MAINLQDLRTWLDASLFARSESSLTTESTPVPRSQMPRLNPSAGVLCVSIFLLAGCSSYNPNKTTKVENLQKVLIDKQASEDDMDFPSHDPSIASGEKVYQQNCAKCHGQSPVGGFLTKEFMRDRTPKDQYLVITKGNDKGMPGFRDTLTRDERWDALMYIRANILGYFPDASEEMSRLNALFGGNCAVCHGTRGDGDGPLHKSLLPPPADFNQFTRLYTKTDNKLFDEISNGIPWTAMPAWKDRYDFDQSFSFDDELRWKLVRYVRQFGFSQTVDRLDIGRKKLEEYERSVK